MLILLSQVPALCKVGKINRKAWELNWNAPDLSNDHEVYGPWHF